MGASSNKHAGGSEKAAERIFAVQDWQNVKTPRVRCTQKKWTFLHAAVWVGRIELVQQMLEKDANAHAEDQEGQTALDFAYELGDHELAVIISNHMKLGDKKLDRLEPETSQRELVKEVQIPLNCIVSHDNVDSCNSPVDDRRRDSEDALVDGDEIKKQIGVMLVSIGQKSLNGSKPSPEYDS